MAHTGTVPKTEPLATNLWPRFPQLVKNQHETGQVMGRETQLAKEIKNPRNLLVGVNQPPPCCDPLLGPFSRENGHSLLICSSLSTAQFNMEPENDAFQKESESPLPGAPHFQVNHVKFRGCNSHPNEAEKAGSTIPSFF